MRQLILALLGIISFSLFGQGPDWNYFSNDHIVYDIETQGDDTLWVATQGGLICLDRNSGNRQYYNATNSPLRGSFVEDVFVDDESTIWLGSSNAGLFSIENGKWTQYYDLGEDTIFQVRQITKLDNGEIWFQGNRTRNCSGCMELYCKKGDNIYNYSEIRKAYNIQELWVHSYAMQEDGSAWMITRDGLVRFKDSTLVEEITTTEINSIPDYNLQHLAVDKNDRLFCVLNDYRNRVNGEYQYSIHVRNTDGTWTELLFGQLGAINYIFQGKDDNLYLSGAKNSGETRFVYKWDGDTLTKFEDSNLPQIASERIPIIRTVDLNGALFGVTFTGSENDLVYSTNFSEWTSYNTDLYPFRTPYFASVTEDCSGKIWLGGSRTLSTFDGTSWTDLEPDHIELRRGEADIRKLIVNGYDCSVWILAGIESGYGIFKYINGHFEKIYGSRYQGFSLISNDEGEVWWALGDKVVKYHNGIEEVFDDTNSPYDGYIADINFGIGGDVWISSRYGGLFRYNNGNWDRFINHNSPIDTANHWSMTDRLGYTYTANRHEIYRYDGDNWENILPGKFRNIQWMKEDPNGLFWIAEQKGMWRWDGKGDPEFFGIENTPLASAPLRDIYFDAAGNHWMVHHIGLTAHNPNGFNNPVWSKKNVVEGLVFYDKNEDGQFNEDLELGIPGFSLVSNLDGRSLQSVTSGVFRHYTENDSFDISLVEDPSFQSTSPETVKGNIDSGQTSMVNFGLIPRGMTKDSANLYLTSSSARCGRNLVLWMDLKNSSLNQLNGEVELIFDRRLDLIQSIPQYISRTDTSLFFQVENLEFLENNLIKVNFDLGAQFQPGDTIEIYSKLFHQTPNGLSELASDNLSKEVRCSFDPNEKSSSSPGLNRGQTSLKKDGLIYTIYFENIGNDTAYDVTIIDNLDDNLNPASFKVLSASHHFITEIVENKVTVHFEDINLLWTAVDPELSQGYIKFAIDVKPDLMDPIDITNSAEIYFDINPPIRTNQTVNTLVNNFNTGVSNIGGTKMVSIAPNPSSGEICLITERSLDIGFDVKICDVSGKIVWEGVISDCATFDFLRNGIYLLEASVGGHISRNSVIIVK